VSRRPGRARHRRRRLTAVALAALCAGVAAAAATGGSGRRHPPAAAPAREPAAAVRPKPAPPQPPPGSLPQTDALPPASGPAVQRLGELLFKAVKVDRIGPALPVFFPLRAYLQVKAIADPAADFHSRLLGDFALDVEAAHRLLGAQAPLARFVELRIPERYAHWVAPGACYNRIGYWEVPNSRLVYALGGRLASFGVASLISWRGVWYVVHLGAVEREAAEGIVDEPAEGPGSSAYLATC